MEKGDFDSVGIEDLSILTDLEREFELVAPEARPAMPER